MIEAVIKVSVEQFSFGAVGSNRRLTNPESRNRGVLLVNDLNGLPKLFMWRKSEFVEVLALVPFSRAWSQIWGQLQSGEEAMLWTRRDESEHCVCACAPYQPTCATP